MQVIRPRYTALTPANSTQTSAAQLTIITDRADLWRPVATQYNAAHRLISVASEQGFQSAATTLTQQLSAEHQQVDEPLTLLVNVGDDLLMDTLSAAVLARWSELCLSIAQWAYQRTHATHVVLIAEQHNVYQPVLAGLLQSASLETARLSVSEIRINRSSDCNGLQDVVAAPWLAQALSVTHSHVVFHQQQWHQRILQDDIVLSEATDAVFSANDVLVILGGAGGVGLALTQQLAARFGCSIVLLGRKPLDATRRAKLKSCGAKSYIRADVTDYQQLSDGLNQVQQRFGRVDCVLNLTGVLADSLLVNLQSAQLYNVLAPKVLSALNIAQLQSDFAVKRVVNFSSYTSVIGNIGQSAYGAANYFLDELSRQYSHWTSINWGLWASEGMQMPDGELAPMAPAAATSTMLQLLSAKIPAAAVIESSSLSDSNHIVPSDSSLLVLDGAALQQACVDWLQALVLAVSKFKRIDVTSSLVDAGLDSVALINVTARIEADLKTVEPSVKINKAIVFDQSSIHALATWLLSEFKPAVQALLATNTNTAATQPSQNSAIKPLTSSTTKVSQQTGQQTGLIPATSDNLTAWLMPIACKIGGLKNVTSQQNLLDLGFDSVMSIRLSAEIERQLKAVNSELPSVSKAVLFDHPSIATLAEYLQSLSASLLLPVEQSTLNTPAHVAESQQSKPTGNATASDPSQNVTTYSANTTTQQSIPESVAEAEPPTTNSASAEFRADDIAILGMAGEFPHSENKTTFWDNLRQGHDAITEIPAERWDWKLDYTSDTALAERDEFSGGSFSRHGGFIADAGEFDAKFFNIAPVEAESLDPQERRFLQTAYHALEDAGYFIEPHGNVAVYVAAMFGHYQALMAEQGALSSSFASIANRVSYQLDLHGPSVAVDSMCSGSMSALHFACNSLKLDDCELAVAGGVNLMTHPGKYRVLSQGKFVSPTGHCHAFGISADGYVPGEGVAAVVLAKYSTALQWQQKGARIHAVIKATALNSGGKVSSFTVPSAKAQQQVIERAISASGVAPAQISYVEAHGTGTSLGDPIEITALNSVYSAKNAEPVCYLGSVKSNVGHLESCAAMAGLFKVVAQLQQKQLAPTLHARIENPWLNLAATRFELVQQPMAWQVPHGERRTAALSSFGAGGANGHAIIQEYPVPDTRQTVSNNATFASGSFQFPISTHTDAALSEYVRRVLAHAKTQSAQLADLSFTLCCARQHLQHRLMFTATSLSELTHQCQQWLATGEAPQSSDTQNDHTATFLAGGDINFLPQFQTLIAAQQVKVISGLHYPFDRQFFWAKALLPEQIFQTQVTDNSTALMAPQWLDDAESVFKQDSGWQQQLQASNVDVLLLGESKHTQWLNTWFAEQLSENQQCFVISEAEIEEQLHMLLMQRKQSPLLVIAIELDWSAATQLTLMQGLQQHRGNVSVVSLNAHNAMASLHGKAAMFRGLAQENNQIAAQHISLAVSSTEQKDSLTRVMALNSELAQAMTEKALQGLEDRASYHQWQLSFSAAENGAKAQIKWARREQLPVTLQRGQQRFRQNGVYMITGGLGMIGRAIAKLLISRYQATVVLLGRSSLNEQKTHILEDLGKQAHYLQADITDKADCVAAVATVLNAHGDLHGVIQSAGILRDALVQNKQAADIEAVWSVKALGSINLDKATAHLPLDFFCLFSSMASQLGNVGQCDYIAANHFLDQFALRRNQKRQQHRRQGHTLAINWPLWLDENQGDQAEAGYNDNYGALASFFEQEMGIVPLTQTLGAQLFIDWVNGAGDELSQVMGFAGDVQKIYQVLVPETHQPNLVRAPAAKPQAIVDANTNDINKTQHTVEPTALALSKDDLMTGLVKAVQAQTQLSVEDIAQDASWGDLGFNSVMMQTFASSMLNTFGVNVPPTALFSYGNIEQLADYLAKQTVSAPVSQSFSPAKDEPEDSADARCAIIGIDGRLPGGETLDDFWQTLMDNRSAIGPVERWDSSDYYAGTIDNIDAFDAKFFGMSAREAMLMDPQHRLFLQTSYNAILNAGYAPEALENVGVFAGVQFNDYQTLLQIWGQSSHPYAATGNAHAMLANRVSYLLNFSGPSQTVDTACSSALVALNRGVMSLQQGECDVALVGAVSLLIDPAISDAAQSMGVLSPDYRCATFDNEANGYVRAEGLGCLLVKPLSAAQRDRDSIYAVIENSVENHGGKANSLTSPNPNAQRALLTRAYTADLAERVSYIETHGTGTELGDPIEIDALKQAFHHLAPNKATHSIALGAVKTNVGHLEPAAAIASLMKMIYAFKHGQLPANIHFNAQNPLIDLQHSPFRLLTENEEWQSSSPRVAGVSSFGFGGSNAHAVLSESPARPVKTQQMDAGYLVVLSARSLVSLKGMCQQLLLALQQKDAEGNRMDLGDLAYTLATGRSQFEYRLCWIAESLHDLKMQMQDVDFSTVSRLRIEKRHTDIEPIEQRQGDAYLQQLEALRDEFLAGKTLRWELLYAGGEYSRLHLPGYVFDCKRFWFEQAADSERMKEINHGNA